VSKRIVNPQTIRPGEVKPGDVMIRTVTLHVFEGPDDTLLYRMYVCPYEPAKSSVDRVLASVVPFEPPVPQGSRIYEGARAVQQEVFPVMGYARAEPDE